MNASDRSEIDEETQQGSERSMSDVRPGKGRKRRITSSKTQTESTSDRSFTSCWSIHHPWQKRSSHVTLRVPASQSLRPRSIIQGPASCACICSCRPAGARASAVLCMPSASRSSFNERRARACMHATLPWPCRARCARSPRALHAAARRHRRHAWHG